MVTRHCGFGLLEVLVVLAVMAILATSAVAYSSAWINQSRINELDGQVKRAVGRARAEALKNPLGAQGDEPVAEVTLAAGRLSVERCADTSCSSSTTTWSEKIRSDISIETGGTALAELRFNSYGQLISHAAPLSYRLKKGTYEDAQAPRTLH